MRKNTLKIYRQEKGQKHSAGFCRQCGFKSINIYIYILYIYKHIFPFPSQTNHEIVLRRAKISQNLKKKKKQHSNP